MTLIHRFIRHIIQHIQTFDEEYIIDHYYHIPKLLEHISIHKQISRACIMNYEPVVKRHIKRVTKYHFQLACMNGQVDIVYYMILHNDSCVDIEMGLAGACYSGNVHLTHLFLSMGAKDVILALIYLSKHPHYSHTIFEILKPLLLELPTDTLNSVLPIVFENDFSLYKYVLILSLKKQHPRLFS